jgi:hypothetical protein
VSGRIRKTAAWGGSLWRQANLVVTEYEGEMTIFSQMQVDFALVTCGRQGETQHTSPPQQAIALHSNLASQLFYEAARNRQAQTLPISPRAVFLWS